MDTICPGRMAKATEVIVWFANAKPNILAHHVINLAALADTIHLRKYGRPMDRGDDHAGAGWPLAQNIGRLLAGTPPEPGNGTLSFSVECETRVVNASRRPSPLHLSASDIEVLRESLDEYSDMSFDELTEIAPRAVWAGALHG
jgi:hypothetical protein